MTRSKRSLSQLRPAAVGVWTVSALAIVLVVLNETGSDLNATVGNAATLLWVAVGAVLITRLPGNRVGWLLWLGGVLLAASLGSGGFATYGLVTNPGSIPGAIWLAWLSAWTGAPAFFIAAGFLPLVYPTGRLPSPRWRFVAILGVIAVTLATIQGAFGPFPGGSYPDGVQNPLLLPGPAADVLAALGVAAGPIGLAFTAAAVVSIVIRYRRSSGVERQQLKLLTYMAAILVVGLAAAFIAEAPIAWLAVVIVLGAMPIAIGIAVLRYRLYDVDMVIRRTAVYVPLTAVLAGIFAASTVLLQRVFVEVTGNPSDGAVVLSTLLLAATFTPVKNRFQAAVDRRFRDAPDAERALAAFTESVADALWEPSRARVMRGFLGTAVRALEASGGAAYIVNAQGEELVGQTAARGQEPSLEIVVRTGDETIGRLQLDERRHARPYSDRETELLRETGERLGRALVDPSAHRVEGAPALRHGPAPQVDGIDAF